MVAKREIKRDAVFSPDGLYRYALDRWWGSAFGFCLFIMLNPSAADAKVDDPTVRRCIGFAREWGFNRLRVINLFSWCATDPAELRSATDPIGTHNDAIIEAEARRVDRLGHATAVCAWGAHPW